MTKEKNKIKVFILIFIAVISICATNYAVNEETQFKLMEQKETNYFIDENGNMCYLIPSSSIPDIEGKYGLNNSILSNSLPSKYVLSNDIIVNGYDQGQTNNCWIYGTNSVIETTYAKEKKKNVPYNMFDVDNIAINVTSTYNKKSTDGGRPEMLLAYYTNGYGPLTKATNQVEKQIGNYTLLGSIYKGKDASGNIEYNGGNYTESQVLTIRNSIKQHIKNYGAVTACMAANAEGPALEYYSNPTLETIMSSEAYFCDYDYNPKGGNTVAPDHQITIIGWDDNYGKENFNSKHRPKNNGAYIVLNSWGKEFSGDGIFYISYEDTYIESCVYGIKNVDEKDYKNLYKHDDIGFVLDMQLNTKINYGANVFKRNTQEPEILKQVSVATDANTQYEIYVNPTSGDLNFDKLIKVAETEVLPGGFHTINLEKEVVLTGSEFAIVVKYNNDKNSSYFGVEYTASMEFGYSSPYKNATLNAGESFIYNEQSKSWIDFKSITQNTTDIYLKQMCNLCIKGFTEEYKGENQSGNNEIQSGDINISTKTYKIQDKYIINVPSNTNKKTFIGQFTTNAESIEVYEGSTKVTDTSIIKTGMILKTTKGNENAEYKIAVIGDSNGDGKVDAKDLISSVKQYKYVKTSGKKGKNLTGESLLAIKYSNATTYTAQDLIGQVREYKKHK